MADGEFSVCMFFPDEQYEYDCRFVDGETAVNRVKTIISSVGGKLGFVKRIIITDGGDCINFEWIHGQGVVYPPPETKT